MTNLVANNNVPRGAMEMDNLLDLLQTTRLENGIVGITQQPREQQAAILRSLMIKFDAKEDTQVVLDKSWALNKKRKGTDPDEEVNVLECRKKIK